jgi:PTS system nitrogen regulatory IIA component
MAQRLTPQPGSRWYPSAATTHGIEQQRAMNLVATSLHREDIHLDVDSSSKRELFDVIGWHMEQAHALPHESVSLGLARREQLSSTGLGLGCAIPHCRVRNLDRILAAYLRLRTPLPFDAPDGAPVSDLLILLVPKQADEEHLQLLAEAAEMFADPRFREGLRQCGDAPAVMRMFADWSPAAFP